MFPGRASAPPRTTEGVCDMKKQLLAGIDVGTTGVKTILFEGNGTVFSSSYQEYGCTYPQTGWVEQDPQMLMEALSATCRQAMEAVDPDQAEVAGVSVSAQRSCVILLDEADAPLKMISWLDNRATEQVLHDFVGIEPRDFAYKPIRKMRVGQDAIAVKLHITPSETQPEVEASDGVTAKKIQNIYVYCQYITRNA